MPVTGLLLAVLDTTLNHGLSHRQRLRGRFVARGADTSLEVPIQPVRATGDRVDVHEGTSPTAASASWVEAEGSGGSRR